MRDENCIFCKIANGEIPSATIYEDDDFRVISWTGDKGTCTDPAKRTCGRYLFY